MRVVSGLLLGSLLLVSLSCEKEKDPTLEQYLFLEQHTSVSGVLISGPEPPIMQIDFPTYSFDENTGVLDGVLNFTINDNLMLIYGSGMSLSGTAGGGAATGLTGVYSIPFERSSFELLKLDTNGNVVFLFNDEVHDLKPGEIWTDQSSRLDTVMVDGDMSVSNISTNQRITNFGFQQKANIQKWDW